MLLPDTQFKEIQKIKQQLKKPRYPETCEEVFRKAFDKLLHAFIPGIKIYWKKKKAGIMEKVVIERQEYYPVLLRGKVIFMLWGKEFAEYDIDQLLEKYEWKH